MLVGPFIYSRIITPIFAYISTKQLLLRKTTMMFSSKLPAIDKQRRHLKAEPIKEAALNIMLCFFYFPARQKEEITLVIAPTEAATLLVPRAKGTGKPILIKQV